MNKPISLEKYNDIADRIPFLKPLSGIKDGFFLRLTISEELRVGSEGIVSGIVGAILKLIAKIKGFFRKMFDWVTGRTSVADESVRRLSVQTVEKVKNPINDLDEDTMKKIMEKRELDMGSFEVTLKDVQNHEKLLDLITRQKIQLQDSSSFLFDVVCWYAEYKSFDIKFSKVFDEHFIRNNQSMCEVLENISDYEFDVNIKKKYYDLKDEIENIIKVNRSNGYEITYFHISRRSLGMQACAVYRV